MSNIKNINAEKNTFSVECWKVKYSYEYDNRYLYESWSDKNTSGTKSYLLHNLSPKIQHNRSTNQLSLKIIRICIIMLLSAVVIYFSEYNARIPLLVPMLVFLTILQLPKNIVKAIPRSWMHIYDNNGQFETSIAIPLDESNEEENERKLFLSGLSKEIESAAAKELYN